MAELLLNKIHMQTMNQHESLFITYYDSDVCIHENIWYISFILKNKKKMYQISMNNLMKF